MSLMRLAGYDPQGLQRIVLANDVVVTGESTPAAQTSNAYTVVGADLARPSFLCAETGNATYTLDTAANIVAALAPFFAYNVNASAVNGTPVYSGIPNGTSWRVRFINAAAFTVTFAATANTGVTVNTRAVIAAGSSTTPNGRDLLVTVTCGMPAQALYCTTVNASAVLSGLTAAQCAQLGVGMVVTNAQAGQQGNTIIGINQNAGTVTMSGNSNATNTTAVLFNFSPTLTAEVI